MEKDYMNTKLKLRVFKNPEEAEDNPDTLAKEQLHLFGKDYFLLGINQEGEKVYLENFSWDCGWYWGGGYLETFNKRKTDINSHYHFKGITEGENINLFDAFNKHFKYSVLTTLEKWEFCDLMQSFYSLREGAEVTGRGGSHYTSPLLKPNKVLADSLNKIIADEVAPIVRGLLS